MNTLREAAQQALTVARLREVLDYCKETGIFTWKAATSKNSRNVIGGKAGCLNNQGYMRIWIDGKQYWSHRLAWLYVHGTWPQYHIDHINGDRADNRFENLRDVSRSVNLQNQRKAVSTSKSGLLGVHLKEGRWLAQIRINGRPFHIGSFDTAEAAHQAYLEVKRTHHAGCTI